jgi:heat shock protein HslJ
MCRFESDYPHHFFKGLVMKAFVLLLGALFLVSACEPEGTQAQAPEGTETQAPETATSPSSVSELGIEDHVWVAEDINGKDIIDNSQIVLSLNAGKASGKSGCNSYNGSYSLKDWEISFGRMSSTRMACAAEAMMTQERDYLDLLSKMKTAQRGKGGALILSTADGQTIRFMAE